MDRGGRVIRSKYGERIAQLVIAPIPDVQFTEVDEGDLGETKEETGVSVAPEDSDHTEFNISHSLVPVDSYRSNAGNV